MANDEKNVLKAPEPALPLPPFETLPEYLLSKAKENAQKGKLYYAIEAISKEKRYFDKFDEETKKIASALFKLGLRKNGHVIYMPAEMIKLHIFLTGVWRANGVCRATYPDDDAATIRSRIIESECSIILCDTNRVHVCKKAVEKINWPVAIITTEKYEGHLSLEDILNDDDGESVPALEIKGSDAALILCTSGTTGPSKGAVLNQDTLVQHIHYFSHIPFTEDKPNVLFSTASHYTGSIFTYCVLAAGKTAVLTGQITKEILFETLAEFKPGLAFAFPTYLLALVAPEAKEKGYDFSSLQYLMTGGTILTPAIKNSLMTLPNVKDVINAFGLSEAGVVITNVRFWANPKNPTYENMPDFATGTPYPGSCVQIRDIDTLEPLGVNKKGELCIKYVGNFHSYFKNPEATEKAFLDGYLRTGDIAYYDEQGYIFVVDRLKEILKYYNNHISPTDLENIIGQHPIVDEVCVVGVSDPGGDVPRAFVTLKKNQSDHLKPDSELNKEIVEYTHARVSDYKQLRGGLYIVPELPKGKTGKITRAIVGKIQV